MAKSKSLPDHAVNVPTYADLELHAAAFGAGFLNFLLVLGPPGVGKSRAIRHALSPDVCWIDGNASPLGIYQAAYEHRGQAIVLDDVDGLYRDRQGIRLLKSLCQTETVKSLSWESNAAALKSRGTPRQFTTNSPLAIIANRWTTANEDVAALEDRGHVIYFDPSPHEIHLHASRWFWDQEIFDFVGRNLYLMRSHSLRVYRLAHESKLAGFDWRAKVLARGLTGAALAVAQLRADPSFAKEEERAQAFIAAGHGSRATYFNHAKKLRPPVTVSQITLTTKTPPTPPTSAFDIREILRRRHGELGSG